ncbi:Hypothetical Protein FCC1311_028542 [Hondaea fermentalgiana]|uniref:Uncharacterized protein n=1 Tax=Hondaea fermentalgiana TaxID=2315210 RepID=A0A2R5GDC8_9STRA|nr:Hypothetical Protein FCC1311_028542 [Hondaea fermentalgiana]|eukprot:GBG26633.1 Hypothetical Protein FCC1311_028542 [Hondaea fermentalgiana]
MANGVLAVGAFQDGGIVNVFEMTHDARPPMSRSRLLASLPPKAPEALPSWRLATTLLPDGDARDFGRTLAIGPLGDRIVVGAPGNSRGTRSSVFVFERCRSESNSTWELAWTLAPADPSTDSFFGSSLSLGTNVLAVASVRDDDLIVYMYEFAKGNLIQLGELKPTQPVLHSDQDVVVARDDEMVLVGAPARQPGDGAVLIFARQHGAAHFTEHAVLENPKPSELRFGATLDIGPQLIAASAVDFDVWRKDQGAVIVFGRDDLAVRSTPRIPQAPQDKFGFKPLLLSTPGQGGEKNDTLVVSAPVGTNHSDSVLFYGANDGTLRGLIPLGSDVWAGPVVTGSGDLVVVGSPFDGLNWTGAVFTTNI